MHLPAGAMLCGVLSLLGVSFVFKKIVMVFNFSFLILLYYLSLFSPSLYYIALAG